jgi:N-acetylglutamate synthase-like GNAT family acetyltransferase
LGLRIQFANCEWLTANGILQHPPYNNQSIFDREETSSADLPIMANEQTLTLTIAPIRSEYPLEQCAALLVEAYNAEPWNDNWTQEQALEKLTCFYNSPKFYGLTATLDGRLVGCCVGNIEPYYSGDYFFLKEMFISVSSQRSGVGTQLLDKLKAYLSSIDIHAIILFTSNKTFPFDFYIKGGFQQMDGMCMMHFGAQGHNVLLPPTLSGCAT